LVSITPRIGWEIVVVCGAAFAFFFKYLSFNYYILLNLAYGGCVDLVSCT
jgi:hypothetical protein